MTEALNATLGEALKMVLLISLVEAPKMLLSLLTPAVSETV